MADEIKTDDEILADLRITADGRVSSQRLRNLYVTLANRAPETNIGVAGYIAVVSEDGAGITYAPIPQEVLPPITPEDEGKFLSIAGGVIVLTVMGDITPSFNSLDFSDALNSQYLAIMI